MRLILKFLALPLMLLAGLLYAVCKFFVVASGTVLGILSGIGFVFSVVLLFTAGTIPGLIWMALSFAVSPFGLPKLAAWLTGKLGGVSDTLKDFIME